jgi:hypothetical protein
MADKNTDFLQSAIKRIQLKRWEVLAAQIAAKISVMIRVPAALLARQITPADQALQVARDLSADGWRLAGFNLGSDHLLVDLERDLLE